MTPKVLFAALAVALCAFTPALSETMSITGMGHGTASSTPMPVSDSLIMVDVGSTYEGFETDDPMNPFASAAGPCFGSLLIDKGAVSGEGLCRYTDGDDEVAVVKWTATGMSAEGRTQGDWEILGGTGKWASMTGSGSFDAGGDGDAYTNNITGEVTMN